MKARENVAKQSESGKSYAGRKWERPIAEVTHFYLNSSNKAVPPHVTYAEAEDMLLARGKMDREKVYVCPCPAFPEPHPLPVLPPTLNQPRVTS